MPAKLVKRGNTYLKKHKIILNERKSEMGDKKLEHIKAQSKIIIQNKYKCAALTLQN